MIPSILVTGFGPFPGVERNPSQSAVERLAAALAAGPAPCAWTAILPTGYEAAGAAVEGLIETLRPRVLLLTGVARGERGFRVERRAANLDDSDTPDVAGEVRRGRTIAPGGPARYDTGAQPLCEVLAAHRLPARESDDAGGYVCNHAYYVARHVAATRAASTRCAFVHLPGDAVHDPQAVAEALLDCARALDD